MADAATDDPFSRRYGATDSPVAAPAAEDDPFTRRYSAAPEPALKGVADVTAPPGYAAPGGTDQGPIYEAGQGFKQGIGDIWQSLHHLSKYVDERVPFLKSLDAKMGLDPDKAIAQGDALTQQFEQQHAENGAAQLGRIGGNIAGTAPLMMAGGTALGAAGNAVKAAAPTAGPVVDFLGGASQGNKLLQLGSRATAGAGQGAGAAALLSGASDQPLADQLQTGATIGAALPVVGAAATGVKNLLTGGGVSPQVASLAQLGIDKYSLPLRAGQISNSPFVRMTDSVLGSLPMSGQAAKNDALREGFTRAVSRTFGEDAPAITQDVMASAKSRIGADFDHVAQNSTLKVDAPFSNDLLRVVSDAKLALPESEFNPVKNQISNILGKISPQGEIDGSTYQALTRKGAPLDRAISSSDPNIRYYAGQIRGALDDMLERSASPDMLDTLRTARSQYKNLKTIEDLAEKAPSGQISPALLLNQVRRSYGNYAYSGGGDLGELAQIGQQFLKEPPSSGTSERLFVRELLHNPIAMLTGGAEAAMHPEYAAAAGASALAGLGVGRGVGALLSSNVYRNRLLSAALNNQPAAGVGGNLAGLPLAIPAGVSGFNRLSQSAGAPPVNR